MPTDSEHDLLKLEASATEPQCLAPDAVAPNEVYGQLKKILDSEAFRRSPQLSRFLAYLVQDTLENQAKGLKEYEIGKQVYNKPETFDVRLDPIVRVEARRLRLRVAEYYAGEGIADPVLIDLGARGYRATFSIRPAASSPKSATNGPPALDQNTAIAVLPFVDMTDQPYFCDGLTEELINALTKVPGLLVASRSSSFQFRSSGQDIRQVGAALGVAVVMEGSVRRQDNRLRVTAQLSSADSGFHLWSETYDIEMEDLFDVQERISHSIVDTLRNAKRAAAIPLLNRKQTDQPSAYRDFLSGLQLQRSSQPDDLVASEARLAAAVAADPGYVSALAMLARTRVKIVWQEYRSPSDGWPLAKSAAEGALQWDNSCAVAHAATGSTRSLADWNWAQAAVAFEQALELGANEAFVQQAWAMHHLTPLGRLDEALSAATVAVELGPGSLEAWTDLGWVRFYRGEIKEAAEQFKAVLADKPDDTRALLGLSRCYLAEQDPKQALATLAAIPKPAGEQPRVMALAAHALVMAGQRPAAELIATQLGAVPAEKRFASLVPAAQVAIALERFEAARGYLHSALELRCPRLVELDVDPIYRGLRSRGLADTIRVAVCLAPAVGN
jgi:TolB-like protein/Tfp pilus assembly protein PilF